MYTQSREVRSVVRTCIPCLTERLVERLLFVTNVTHSKLYQTRGRSRKPKLHHSSPNYDAASKNIPQNGSPSRPMEYFCSRLRPLPCSYAPTPPRHCGNPAPIMASPALSYVLIHKTCSLSQSKTISFLSTTPQKIGQCRLPQLDHLFKLNCH